MNYRRGNYIAIEMDGKQYRGVIYAPEERNPWYMMLSKIAVRPAGSEIKLREESAEDKEWRALVEARFPDEDAFDVLRNMVMKGFAWGEKSKVNVGQVRILVNRQGEPVYDERINVPGRPFPRDGKEYLLRLKGEF